MNYALHFNPDRCGDCHTCEVACKAAHNLRPHANEKPGTIAPSFRRVVSLVEGDAEATSVQYISMACMHCGDAACMNVCPAKAITRDPEFGVVLPNPDRCLGCHYCSWACEFGAPQFNDDGLMFKCDGCIDRLREGKKPACVESCCGGALAFEPIQELTEHTRETAARKLAAIAQPRYIYL